jgi:predicted nucleic acid-binding Zn ribbon protein
LKSSWVPLRFGDKLKTGFCLGCGGKTRYVKDQLKLTGEQGDSLNWHRACYRRLYQMWTRDLFREDRLLRCAVCRKAFTAARKGGHHQKLCSPECRKEWNRRLYQEWRKSHVCRPLPRHKLGCIVCGREFEVGGGLGRWNKKTCSDACRKERDRRLAAARRKAHRGPLKVDWLGYQRTCVVCGKSFKIGIPKEWRRNTCSLACRNERSLRMSAAWDKANRERSNEWQRAYRYQRYHSDPIYRKKMLEKGRVFKALRRARLRG